MIMWQGTVQSKYNARARSAARSSCAVRTRKPLQENVVFLRFARRNFRNAFETQEVESLTAKSRRKLKI